MYIPSLFLSRFIVAIIVYHFVEQYLFYLFQTLKWQRIFGIIKGKSQKIPFIYPSMVSLNTNSEALMKIKFTNIIKEKKNNSFEDSFVVI